MLASEVPAVMSKAVECFISDMTLAAYEACQRRLATTEASSLSLQQADVVEATKSDDQFDFLIDIVGRQ